MEMERGAWSANLAAFPNRQQGGTRRSAPRKPVYHGDQRRDRAGPIDGRLPVTTVAACRHGTWREFDLVVLRGVEGFVGRVEQVFPTGLEKVRHGDHPHYVVKVRWCRATTRDEVALQRFETPPGRVSDQDGVSHEVCQDLRRFE